MKSFAFILFAILAAVVLPLDRAARLEAGDSTTVWPSRASAGIVIHESVIRRMVADQRRQQEPVAKVLLGASVEGCQTTITDVTADVRPDPDRIRIDLICTGHVQSRTQSRNSQVRVSSLGSHQFRLTKPVAFDGVSLRTQKCYGTIHASQMPLRAISQVSGVPIVGPLADRAVWSEVLRRSAVIDQALAVDLSEDILPKIDQQADDALAELNHQIPDLQAFIARQLMSDSWKLTAQSGDSTASLWLSPVLAGNGAVEFPGDSGDGAPNRFVADDHEVIVVYVSEQFATELLNRFLPAGAIIADSQLNSLMSGLPARRTMSSDEALQTWKSVFAEFGSVDTREPQHGVYSLQLAEQDPVRILFQGGEVRIRSTFQIVSGFGIASGWQTTEARLRGVPQNTDFWSPMVTAISLVESSATDLGQPNATQDTELTIPDLSSEPMDSAPASGVLTVTTGTVWSQLIDSTTSAIMAKLPIVLLPRVLNFSGIHPGAPGQASGRMRLPDLRLHRIRSEDGVLRISFREEPEVRFAEPSTVNP